MDTYKIIRFRMNGNKRVIQSGLTLEQAQKHCRDPKTKGGDPAKGTAWFDGYDKE